MRRSYYEIYLHFVWRTKKSEPYLSSLVEREVNNIIQACPKKGCSSRLGNNRPISPALVGVYRIHSRVGLARGYWHYIKAVSQSIWGI